ncbi:MAG: hypothetical protein HOH43_04590 [Candidatus Latescibacteria bacterium]|jgi:hypothetical protein|nr:hypothetical protein [Candidatus Latescibacterota bacterium]
MLILTSMLTASFIWVSAAKLADYPPWFLKMPEESGVHFAVGLSRAYAKRDSSVSQAVRDAMYQLRIAAETTIKGERLFQMLPGGRTVYQGEVFLEQPGKAATPCFLDTVEASGMVMVLAATRRPDHYDAEVGTIPQHAPPSWVTDIPKDSNGVYAVGMARAYYYEENSWREAERQARQELAYSIAARQRRLFKGTTETSFGVTASATAVRLTGVQTMERWRSESVCFVLIRADSGATAPQ